MHKKIRIFLMTPLVLFGCSDESDLSEDFTTSSQALKTCSIVLGGGGKSQTITQSFSGTTVDASLYNKPNGFPYDISED